MKQIIAAIASAIIVTSSNANAAIVDLPNCDGVGYFKDLVTGKVWVDVNKFEHMSYSEIELSIRGSHFHIATTSELVDLFHDVTYSNDSDYMAMGITKQMDGPFHWYEINGFTYDKNPFDGEAYMGIIAGIWMNGSLWLSGDNPNAIFHADGKSKFLWWNDYKQVLEGNNISAWVVQDPVPIPPTILLFGTCIAGLTGSRLRRKIGSATI